MKIKRDSRKRGYSLEKRIYVSIFFLIGGLVLSFTALTLTGNAISNLTETNQGLLGVILFIAGLFGIVFSRD